ncbi:T9SS type B sorting domain-containing protein [Flavobacterium sp. TSSA_36]|uniref:Ig-like domain-containing protein n=1 Tax=Flavobacterium sp. TSSA_36 TaxID=3447669 RepID=UPI003F2ABC7C
MKVSFLNSIFFCFAVFSTNLASAIDPPKITATGNQAYCPGSSIKIIETITISYDPSETAAEAMYVQISTGYTPFDLLSLDNPTLHPTIKKDWDPSTGKLKLYSSSGIKVSYNDFIAALKDVSFSNSSPTPSGSRTFSITLGQANYLPSTGHYYQFISGIGISWTAAKMQAELQTYYGLKGYLATLLSLEETKLCGEQSNGAGWIGGTDEKVEGQWRWATGPEGLANAGEGLIFWNGNANGSTPNFAYWNNNEPNQMGNEDYAHITAPGVGIAGSWNDLSLMGDVSGNYQPKGYIIEFGGMPGDPVLQLSASTSITIPAILSTTPASKCDSGLLTLQATASIGTINWYDQNSGGNLVGNGSSFTTPFLNTTTTYFVSTTAGGCTTNRTAVVATINPTPTITTTNTPVSHCGPAVVTLTATPSSGTINWYADATSTTKLGTGTSFVTPFLNANTTFYAEAVNANCSIGTRVPVAVQIYPLPVVTDEEKIMCQSNPVTLDAGLSGMSYLWSTGATTPTIQVTDIGNYYVTITSPAPENCTSTKNVTVIRQIVPEIKKIIVNETTVTIALTNTAPYFEYSLDNIRYQNSTIFTEVPAGIQTAYVRDTSFCNWDQEQFIVMNPPKFFTPNNDGFNDVWYVKDFETFPKSRITIFDQYGKVLIELSPTKLSWDGTYNQKPLPSSDYWYVVKLDDSGVEKRGHFSLKR